MSTIVPDTDWSVDIDGPIPRYTLIGTALRSMPPSPLDNPNGIPPLARIEVTRVPIRYSDLTELIAARHLDDPELLDATARTIAAMADR